MSCNRCGGNKATRPTPPPSVVGRPGTMVPTSGRVGGASQDAWNAITGLRYVPSSTGK